MLKIDLILHHFSVTSGNAGTRGPDHKIPGSSGCKPQWCCHCKVVVLGNGVQKAIKDLPVHMKVPDALAAQSCIY